MNPVTGLARLPGQNTTKMAEHKLVSFAAVVALWTLGTLLIKLIGIQDKKLCHFGR